MATWSNISTSQLVGAIRLDAEFWQPTYVEKEHFIRSGRHVPLGRLVSLFKKGIFYILAREYAPNGIAFYRSSNVGSVLPSDESLAFITGAKHGEEIKTALTHGDLMIVKTGKSGASVVFRERCNVSQDVIATKVRKEQVNPFYLAVYLNTRFGSSEMNRWFQGQVQPHLSLDDARKIRVALVADSEQARVETLVRSAASTLASADDSFKSARHLLESELGLDKLSFEKPVGFAARFSELEEARRSDAQHYQPRFAQLLQHLSVFPTKKVREIRTYNRRGIQPVYVKDGEVAVVNSQHLGKKHIDYEGLQKTTMTHFLNSPEAHVKPNDLLIYSTGAYVGRTNAYLKKEEALASNHVNILRVDPEIDAAYLALVIQSAVGQLQTQRHARGSAQAELYPSDIDRFVVPLLDRQVQSKIGNLVRKSLAKQTESKLLLEKAKTRVEQLIEEAGQS